MEKINVKINSVESLVDIQRYFLLDGESYFIYSNEEADTDGNVKIYVAKIIDNNQVVAINNGEEWDKIKKTIVEIINDNKECAKLDIEDLNPASLANVEVTEARALRLPSAVMHYLNANIPSFEVITAINNNEKLDSFNEKIADINDEINNMLETTKEIDVKPIVESNVPEISSDINETKNSDDINEAKMEATMEIIMPSKQIKVEVEEPKKKKGKFNFKGIFGKKEDIPLIEEIKAAESKVEQKSENIEQQENTDIKTDLIVEKSDLPEPKELNPIIIGNDKVDVKNEQEDNSGFDFFTTVQNEVTQDNEEKISSPMEVLTLEEDLKYKKMYEEIIEKNNELENKIFEMQKAIEIYEAKIQEINNITK